MSWLAQILPVSHTTHLVRTWLMLHCVHTHNIVSLLLVCSHLITCSLIHPYPLQCVQGTLLRLVRYPVCAICCNGDCLVPSGPPQEVRNVSTGIRDIEMDWKFPQFSNGIITQFTVRT